MFTVTLIIDTLDAASPQEAVKMFLDAAANAEPLYFIVTTPDGTIVQVSSDMMAPHTLDSVAPGA